jgi:hypothetical protein
MNLEILLVVFVTVLVFGSGMVCGYYLYSRGHNSGVKLVDRLKHDLVPFEDDIEEEVVQTFTDGTFEKIEDL